MDKKLCFEKLKMLIILFLFGVFGGCIYFNILWRFQGPLFQNEWGMVLDRVLAHSLMDLFLGFNQHAVKILIFHMAMGVLGLTWIGRIFTEGIVISAGFLVGAAQTMLLLCFDIKEGILFCVRVAAIILVPALTIGTAFVLVCAMSSLKGIFRDKTEKWRNIQIKKYLFFLLGTLILHMVYIFACSYVNGEKIFENFFGG